MNNRPTIEILMATFNGESYVSEQIDSLLRQTYYDWQLIIRDDGSDDNTLGILQCYRSQYPDKIILLDDGKLNLGARSNFSRLLKHAKADYIMLCDQDDVWLPHKISITFDKIKELERDYGQKTPLLVHTDAIVVDSKLLEIARSLWQYQKSDPEKGATLRRLLLQNVATGCTVMINKPLCDMALPIPDDAMMHDWWLTVVASVFGHIGYISEPTILYRQHERSDIGAKSWNLTTVLRQLSNPRKLQKSLNDSKIVTSKLQKQANNLLKQFGDLLGDEDKEMIDVYSHLSEQNYFMRRYYIIKYSFFYTDLLRNIGRLLLA